MSYTTSLSGLLLSAGDVDGAIDVMRVGLARDVGGGPFGYTVYYNLLLALVVADRLDEAVAHLLQRPWLLETGVLDAISPLRELVAVLRIHEGRPEEADALLGHPGPEWSRNMAAVQSNRAWLEARVHLARGRPAQARRVLEDGLEAALRATQPMSPLNATQMHRLLADACEALGDVPAALAALRQSHSHCVAWVGDSVRAHVTTVQASSGGPPEPTHGRRLHTLEEAVRAAQAALAQERIQATRQRQHLAQVVHELRNPIVGVVGLTSMLTLSRLESRDQLFVELAQSQAQLLLSLCNDLLDHSKLEAGRFELHLQPCDLGQKLADTARAVQPLAELRGLRLDWSIDRALPPRLHCDGLRVQQVLTNLLGNALKFTTKGEIEVHVRWLASPGREADFPSVGDLHVKVRDTGTGMRPETLARLFEAFGPTELPSDGSRAGHGLGLALSRQLVQSMGGSLRASSAWGAGSVIGFVLPLQAAD